jgi:hypothetical protein
MPSLRISLAGSLGIVAVIAMGLAGMVSASSLWTTAAATVTLAVLLTALLAARLLEGIDRAFWAGFALFGWSYLILVNWDWVGGQFGHDLTAGLSDVAEAVFPEVPVTATPLPAPPPTPTPTRLIRGRVSDPGAALLPAPGAVPAPPPSTAAASTTQYLQLVRERQIKLGNFVQIGRMFLSLAFGLLGAWIAQVFARRRESAANAAEPVRSDPPGRGAG